MIEGIPDGWELVRVGVIYPGEHWVGSNGSPLKWQSEHPSTHLNYPVIRKTEKPKQYRPFANAAEFAPHRDRWIRRSNAGRPNAKGCYRYSAYDDRGVFEGLASSVCTYSELFNDGRQFDDGSPFGVEV